MKKYPILYLLLAFFFLTGCQDFLAEENKSNIESDQYYATAEGYEKVVNASYSSLRTVYSEPWLFSAGTDLFVEGRDVQPKGISEYRELTSEEAAVETFYRNAYSAIQICNTALFFNDKTATAPTLASRKGEVKFLRAYYYFLLVQNFGGVALVTDRITEPVGQFPRNSTQEVYDFIIAEMNEALGLVDENPADFGRVSKRAIRHFLAKIYLTRGYETFGSPQDFAQAAALADAAINGQPLALSFEDLFFPGNEKNAEILFSIQYDPTSIASPTTGGHNQNYWWTLHGRPGGRARVSAAGLPAGANYVFIRCFYSKRYPVRKYFYDRVLPAVLRLLR